MAPTTPKAAPTIIAVAGGSGSGKTTLARKILNSLGEESALILSQDSYYHDQSKHFDGDGGSVNFDHPDALDFSLLATHLKTLKNGKSIEVPIYDFTTHARSKKTMHMEPKPIVLVDGTLVLSQKNLLPYFTHSIFLDVSEPVRFERRLKRDVSERGREPEGIRRQFEKQVAPMHNQFVQPSKANATHVLKEGEDFDIWVKDFLKRSKV